MTVTTSNGSRMTPVPNPATELLCRDGYRVEWYREPGSDRDRCEAELLSAGHPLPLPHRTAWAEFRRPAKSWFVAVRDAGRVCRAGFAVEVGRSRSLPGHVVLRAERFGQACWPAPVRDVCVSAIERLARGHRRVLRLHVELFAPDADTRTSLDRNLAGRGFRPIENTRRYPRTLALDLRPTEDDLLRALDGGTRRKVRAAAKKALAVRPIDDPAWAGRMADLHRETMGRTGGSGRGPDFFARCVRFAAAYPDLSHLFGLFRTDATGPESLLAFAWGCRHGDSVHYDAAACTRRSELNVSMGYPLMWELIVWARRQGATWFDFGGVTAGAHGTDDRLGGISDFKRHFTETIVEVGGEWVLEPRPARARVAGLVSGGAAWLARIRSSLSASRSA
jgi:Acetyltransferase (GNAT) domain